MRTRILLRAAVEVIGGFSLLMLWAVAFIFIFEDSKADHPVHTWRQVADYYVEDRQGRRKQVCEWEAVQHRGMTRTTAGRPRCPYPSR